jgi:hypothetical protein
MAGVMLFVPGRYGYNTGWRGVGYGHPDRGLPEWNEVVLGLGDIEGSELFARLTI